MSRGWTAEPSAMGQEARGNQAVTDLEFLSQQIAVSLKASGFAHIQQPLSPQVFEQLAYHLGAIELRTDLITDADRHRAQQHTRAYQPEWPRVSERPSVHQCEALPFHTDRPQINIIAWYCVEQDDVDGTTLLIDTGDLPRHFLSDERTVLSSVRVWHTQRRPDTNEEEFFQAPLLSLHGTQQRLYYAPWLLPETCSADQARVLRKFHRYVEHKQEAALLRIRLRRHESLFIDNHRMLHGRNRLSENSKRHLIRLYIRTAVDNTDQGGHRAPQI